jgi:tetratricopeptide (TPR) repeat protein
LLAVSLALGPFGCAAVPTTSGPSSGSPVKTPAKEPDRRRAPAIVASLELTDEARIFLEEGRVGDAIRRLERAINLHPACGRCFYYLAEAWIVKGNVRQAAEFHRLAVDYLAGEREWAARVRQQKRLIEKKGRGNLGDTIL